MSDAAKRQSMRETLAAHSLMSIPEVAHFLGVDRAVVVGMLEREELPSVLVGRRRKVDPIDLAVLVLAGREGCTAGEYWKRHGVETGEHARRYIQTVERWQDAA